MSNNINGYVYLTDVGGTKIKPITDLAAINMTTSNGIEVQSAGGGTIGIVPGYIESKYYNNMVSQNVGPAVPQDAYVDGGTMYTLLGGYTVSQDVPGQDPSPYKVPSEQAVRAAIDAYVATGGTDIVPGVGINVTSGSINVTAADGISVNAEGVSVKAGAGIRVASNGVSVVTATNNTFGGIAGATNGVTLVDGVAQVNAGDGLLIDSGKVVIDESSVETTLQDVRIDNGSTVSPVDDQVVTPGNLRGALSVGQAVDVTCGPQAVNDFIKVSFDGGSSWLDMNTTKLQDGTIDSSKFLGDFIIKTADSQPTTANAAFGFTTSGLFPKRADGLKYLVMMDIKNTSTANLSASIMYTSNAGALVDGVPRSFSGTVPQSDYTRIAIIMEGTGNNATAFLNTKISQVGTIQLNIKNWRQYEVTALTDEAIAYIAQLEDPDAFFRAASVYSLRDKYLVKQDMVCPFIPTISMPDNSDLTVAAGLSYKIRYTNDSPHKITADTIPTDAYGWDAHIQMFIKGTSSIIFEKPLILMDALTPNVGHNLLVKFRNGDAFVYVEDTNAGYIVTEPSGTGAGTLSFGITDPETDYVIFAATLDGTTVDAGTAAFVGGSTINTLNILGNGMDKTSITGDIGAASGMTINFQSLTIDGGTFGGAGTISLDDVCINDFITNTSTNLYIQVIDVSANNNTVVITGGVITAQAGAQVIPYGETKPVAVEGTGNNLLNNGKLGFLVSVASGTASNTLYDALVGGGTVYSNVIFDPALNGTTISLSDVAIPRAFSLYGNGTTLTVISSSLATAATGNIVIEDVDWSGCLATKGSFTAKNCIFRNITGSIQPGTYKYGIGGDGAKNITNCTFTGCTEATGAMGVVYAYTSGANKLTLTNCIFNANHSRLLSCFDAVITGCTFSNNESWRQNAYGSGTTIDCHAGNTQITDCLFTGTYKEGGTPVILVGTATITGSTFATSSDNIVTGGTITFAGTNSINSTASGGGTFKFNDNSILDLTGNTNTAVISGSSISILGTLTVKPYGGGSDVVITGPTAGSQLSNTGVLS